jgi:hypothetical protein
MRSHLDQGCEECLESVALWKAVLESVSPDESYRIPSLVLSRLTAEYRAHKPWKWLAEAADWAELVFDSFLQPQPILVRGPASASRQLIHTAEPFVIDLRLEADQVRNRVSLIGQILNSRRPDEGMPSVQAILLNGDDLVVGKTAASSSGEFELQCEFESNLRLFINIRGQRAIGVALTPLVS